MSRIVAMTNLEPLEALTGAAAEYVAAVDAYFANQPAEGYEDDTQYASAIDRAEQALRQRQGGTSATSALATFAPLIDEVRRLREIALDASVLSIQQTICEDSTFKSDEDAEEAFGLLYAAWATLREHLKGGES